MVAPSLGQKTVAALNGLKDAGEKSFEALMAMLLAQYIGHSIRLCKSGYQAGIDALAETPIALEMKRYGSQKKLDRRELQGEISDAALVYPHLQLWVLITTAGVDASTAQALHDTAAAQGLFLLILDNMATQAALPHVPSIAAVCAGYPETTLQAITATDWHDTKSTSPMPPGHEVHDELQAIRALPDFPQWHERFRTELTALPLGPFITKQQNQRLAKVLHNEAQIVFGTDFDAIQVVPRTAKQQIGAWFQHVMGATAPETAVVLGERYDGKTWCVFDWLREHLPTLSIPVFIIGSQRGSNGTKALRDHIRDDLERVLGPYQRHADAILTRQLEAQHSQFPWSLVVLDGVNEYASDPPQWLEHLAWASGRLDVDARCAVLVTVRQQAWTVYAPRVKTKLREIGVGPYDATEFQAALQLHGLPADCLASIPATAYTMIQRPRYLSLVMRHQARLGRYEAVTPEVLAWLDACDKIGRASPHHMPGFDEEHYQGVLKDLATRYVINQGGLKLPEVRDVIGNYSSTIATVLRDLQSEGVLVKHGARYAVHPDRLAIGMGLYLWDSLASGQPNNLEEYVRDILAPLQECQKRLQRNELARFYHWKKHNRLAPLNLYKRQC